LALIQEDYIKASKLVKSEDTRICFGDMSFVALSGTKKLIPTMSTYSEKNPLEESAFSDAVFI